MWIPNYGGIQIFADRILHLQMKVVSSPPVEGQSNLE
jgi:hypothetical protein